MEAWKVVVMSQERMTFTREARRFDASSCNALTVHKGHFVVYNFDQRCFLVPLAYLRNRIVRELSEMDKEEDGLPNHGPTTFPCDSVFMDCIVSLIRRHACRDLEKQTSYSVQLIDTYQTQVSNKVKAIRSC
ncbi:auxin-responsive protein SAUR66-like [Diospyros lotus]|uniref:auxin-responsive protein SAUR66-like n=1 Tax=Diospyros lotus TaxID=55363 RepID=UPI00224E9600|nr:auxin-responsive protein SAUR66-like [Diospyros lotus]